MHKSDEVVPPSPRCSQLIMANVSLVQPPDTDCWLSYTNDTYSLDEAKAACSLQGHSNVTQRMIDSLGLTNFDNYLQAYCELHLLIGSQTRP
jgi:hypothetical protein